MVTFWLQFNDILNTLFSSPPTVALIVGTLLDNTLEAKHTGVDRGLPWWVPFQNRKGDSRNEEFYSFPHRFNEYIPTRNYSLALYSLEIGTKIDLGWNGEWRIESGEWRIDSLVEDVLTVQSVVEAVLTIGVAGGGCAHWWSYGLSLDLTRFLWSFSSETNVVQWLELIRDFGWLRVFNDILNTLFSSPPTVALTIGTLLDNTLEAKHTGVDRGLPWWVPFQNRKGDSRNEEFYSFPHRFNEMCSLLNRWWRQCSLLEVMVSLFVEVAGGGCAHWWSYGLSLDLTRFLWSFSSETIVVQWLELIRDFGWLRVVEEEES
ncbi:unnamed protein product [Ilex paraguariensis]|uniref:Uncharacterized protein n=1 Tax=Ilex paraguariensis TaxID=185542 RepID=A0ABC8SJV9_9AQUA